MARNPRAFEGGAEQAENTENTAQNEGQVNTGETTNSGEGASEATAAAAVVAEPQVDLSSMTAAQRIAYLAQQKTGKASKAAAKEKKASEAKPKIMLNDPENGEPIARTDLIRRLWTQDKLSRSAITTVLNDPSVNKPAADGTAAKKIPYQIVFAALKGVEGGPPKVEKPATANAETVVAVTSTESGVGASEAGSQQAAE
jgi:hypothetical protein